MPRAYVRRPRAGRAVRAGDRPPGTAALETSPRGPAPTRACQWRRLQCLPWLQRCPRAGRPTSCSARCSTASGSSTSCPRPRAPRPHAARSSTPSSSGCSTSLRPGARSTRPPRWSRRSGPPCSRPSRARRRWSTSDDPEALATVGQGRRGAGRAVVLAGGPHPARAGRARALRRDRSRRADACAATSTGWMSPPPARSGSWTTRRGARRRELFEGKALFQMKFYALVLWRLHGMVPAHAAAGLPRQRRDRPLLPGRGTTCGPPSASSRRCGRPSSTRPPPATGGPAPAGCATGATTGPSARPGAALPRSCPRAPSSFALNPRSSAAIDPNED